METKYGLLKQGNKLVISEIYLEIDNEILDILDEFDENKQLDFEQILNDLQETNCYYEFDSHTNKWLTHYMKEV
jgi:gamma-glutamylcyclotransferase (GGCT)/AIG2-like uncharacterized protein YtfP